MKIEYQVCSLNQSVRLKELGVSQDVFMYWVWYFNSEKHYLHRKQTAEKMITYSSQKFGHLGESNMCAAFTVAELGCMLGEQRAIVVENVDNTEAIDRANHLILCLENNVLTSEEVNKRLNHE
jgi:hypothetical protein